MRQTFLMRTEVFTPSEPVRDADGNVIDIRVTRTRNTNGYNSITLNVGREQIDFTDRIFDDEYEIAVSVVRDLLNMAVNHPCTLPEAK